MDTGIQKYMAFVKTVEYGSFTKAAEILSYSQSGISRMIRDLEQDWGVSLLERSKAGVRLTSDGMKLLPHAKRVCEAYETLQMEVDDLSGLQSGMIRIGTFSSVATHWLPNMIREFQKDYPHIDYELLLGDYEEIEAWIAEGQVDFGFLRLPTRPDFETILLAEDPHMAVLPENHPLAAAKTVSLSALQKEPFILLERSGKADVSRIFQENGLNPNVRFTTWDDYAVMSMVENGLGLSILPRLILQRVPYRIAVRPLDVPACRSIGLAMRNRAHLPLAAKRFLDYLPCRDTPSVDNPALSY